MSSNSSFEGARDRVLLDPGSERQPVPTPGPKRPESLDGLTIGFLDISKARGNLFLDRVQEHFEERGAKVIRYSKPTFTKPAPLDLRQSIASECGAVIEALAD